MTKVSPTKPSVGWRHGGWTKRLATKLPPIGGVPLKDVVFAGLDAATTPLPLHLDVIKADGDGSPRRASQPWTRTLPLPCTRLAPADGLR